VGMLHFLLRNSLPVLTKEKGGGKFLHLEYSGGSCTSERKQWSGLNIDSKIPRSGGKRRYRESRQR